MALQPSPAQGRSSLTSGSPGRAGGQRSRVRKLPSAVFVTRPLWKGASPGWLDRVSRSGGQIPQRPSEFVLTFGSLRPLSSLNASQPIKAMTCQEVTWRGFWDQYPSPTPARSWLMLCRGASRQPDLSVEKGRRRCACHRRGPAGPTPSAPRPLQEREIYYFCSLLVLICRLCP